MRWVSKNYIYLAFKWLKLARTGYLKTGANETLVFIYSPFETFFSKIKAFLFYNGFAYWIFEKQTSFQMGASLPYFI
jgi:hypothetical protein